ncbi:MAG: hypothetical protein QW701_01325 [Candidatus Nezhaarchaeales archaeon]
MSIPLPLSLFVETLILLWVVNIWFWVGYKALSKEAKRPKAPA